MAYGEITEGQIAVTAIGTCSESEPMTLDISTYPTCSPMTYTYTGSVQTFIVPNGVTQVTIDAYGAQGYDATYGGKGGRAKGTKSVTPGQTLYIYVGQFGDGAGGGWNGGESSTNGNGCNSTLGGQGYGGGASDVRVGGTALANRVIVAGGGGGKGLLGPCGASVPKYGGAGGGNIGGAGSTNSTATGGGGGTQSAGGTGGSGNLGTGAAGTLGNGGDRCPGDMEGSDGGGGYYGGGGGGGNGGCHRGGGGGGSNYLGGVNAIANEQGVQSGDGKIIITW